MSSNRTNDGLDASGTTDAYSQGGGRGNTTYRSNDGLDASGTTDAYDSRSGGGNFSNRTNDGLDASGTSDAYGGDGSDRRRMNESNDTTGGTSGGLGYDDTIGSNQRTGGGQRGGDQETSQHTSGGLGENDTYGTEADTGGADTGYDHNYGMGSGRTISQEKGGPLPTEPGRQDIHRGSEDYDPRPGEDEVQYEREVPESKPQPTYNNGNDQGTESNKNDSTAGKLMEKAGGLFKNEGLKEKGEEKRRQAGGGAVGGGSEY